MENESFVCVRKFTPKFEAIFYDGSNRFEVLNFLGCDSYYIFSTKNAHDAIIVQTEFGDTELFPGNYIVLSDILPIRIVAKEEFEKTYEVVDELQDR